MKTRGAVDREDLLPAPRGGMPGYPAAAHRRRPATVAAALLCCLLLATSAHAAEGPAADSDPDRAGAAATTPADRAMPDPEGDAPAPAAAPDSEAAGPSPDVFVPSEGISEDFTVSFPVDI